MGWYSAVIRLLAERFELGVGKLQIEGRIADNEWGRQLEGNGKCRPDSASMASS